jgi:predicted dienelactone hydrolase
MCRLLFYFWVLCFPVHVVFGQTDYSAKGEHRVEIIEFNTLTDTSRSKNIPIKVHYPKENGKYPLIVISHGAGGNRDTHYGLADHLASFGYVVFCLEHIGSNTKSLQSSFRIMKNLKTMIHNGEEVLGRPKDVSFIIDQAIIFNEKNDILKNKIDIENIGVLGHSFGAYTSMAIAGIKPVLDWLEPRKEYKTGLAPDMRDKRVKACIALSPQGIGTPFFKEESFHSLAIPLMGITGTEDKLLGGISSTSRYNAFEYWPENGNHIFIWLNQVQHLDFTDNEGKETKGIKTKNQKEVQKIVRASSLLFFNQHLKNDDEAKQLLSDEGLIPYLGKNINSIEVRKK